MQKISDKARTHTNALLAYMMTAPTRDDLETWWSKRHPVRLELHRLLRDLADDGRLTKDGDTYRVPSQAPVPSPRKAPHLSEVRDRVIVEVKIPKGARLPGAYAPAVFRGGTASAAVAPPAKVMDLPAGARLACVEPGVPPRVTIEMGSGGDTVKIIGAPARVAAMADAYQRQVAAEVEATRKATVTLTPAPVAARKVPPAKPAPRPLAPVLVDPPAPTSAAGRILAALCRKPDDGPGLTRRLKMNSNTVRGRLSELSRAGWIEMDAACRWEVTR